MHCVFLVYVKIKYLTKIAQTIGEENGSNLLGGPYSTHEQEYYNLDIDQD